MGRYLGIVYDVKLEGSLTVIDYNMTDYLNKAVNQYGNLAGTSPDKSPKVFLLENAKGLLTILEGKFYKQVMDELDRPKAEIASSLQSVIAGVTSGFA